MTPVAAVIIPVYQHAESVAEAIESAVAQTVPVMAIVVDDGSTDEIDPIRRGYAGHPQVMWHTQTHCGPSTARNTGLAIVNTALGVDYVMFLDADDVIAPTKIADQLLEFTPDVGWVLCDVDIHDAARRSVERASQRYRYDEKELSGWIRPLLTEGNFIPIHAPLVRRAVLEGIRFDDRLVPEDWHFWCAVAAVARVRYVPKVLATYRKGRTGRSRRNVAVRKHSPNLTMPLRLNLGCGTPATRSWHPIDGMENLDKSMGWSFEDGLGDYLDHSVDGITVSHSLMYVPLDQWPQVFDEFARVLADGGVIRITEDDAMSSESSRKGGWKGSEPAVTLIDAAVVRKHLEQAGLVVTDVDAQATTYRDRSLMQAQHGATPDVFFIEGRKLPGTVFAPHNDDEALFCAFTIRRYRPRVVVCYRSERDYGDSAVREQETREAARLLGARSVDQWDGGDLVDQMRAFDARVHPIRVWAPSEEASHPDHVAVAQAATDVFGARVTRYHTYVNGEKVRTGREVSYETTWIADKLRALAVYRSQLMHPRAHRFFLQDLLEYQSA